MTPAEVADTLRVSPNQLKKLRARGTGPTYTKVGRSVRYNATEVVGYLEANKQPGKAPRRG